MSGLRDDIAERLAKLLPNAMVIPVDGSRVDAEYGDQPRPWVSIGLEYTDASYEAHAATALADRLEAGDKAIAERDALLNALADCVVKCTEYGKQDGGFVAFYITPTGPIHRAIPVLQEHGITVRPGFDGRPCAAGTCSHPEHTAALAPRPPDQHDGGV